MMEITVKLYGVLRRHRPESVGGAPHKPFTIELPDGTTVAELSSQLNIGEGFVSAIAVNSDSVPESTLLHDGDTVSLFPPSSGGRDVQVFIAGIMQGSRSDHLIGEQDYRVRISEALQQHLPRVKITDPWTLFPDSVDYDLAQARQTFDTLTDLAAEADVLIAYLPQASMGTAIEMWSAFHAGKTIIAVTPLAHNWVVLSTADEIFPDLDSFIAAIEDGGLTELLGS